jgi:hypothetical protein
VNARTPIVLTRHAEDMLVERAIEREWLERTLANPDSAEPDRSGRASCAHIAPFPSMETACCESHMFRSAKGVEC